MGALGSAGLGFGVDSLGFSCLREANLLFLCTENQL